jgi:hypothetical protein
MEVFYTMDGNTLGPTPPPSEPRADWSDKPQLDRHQRTLRWPFSWQVFETMGAARLPVTEETTASRKTGTKQGNSGVKDDRLFPSFTTNVFPTLVVAFFVGLMLALLHLHDMSSHSKSPGISVNMDDARELWPYLSVQFTD